MESLLAIQVSSYISLEKRRDKEERRKRAVTVHPLRYIPSGGEWKRPKRLMGEGDEHQQKRGYKIESSSHLGIGGGGGGNLIKKTPPAKGI